MKKKSREGEGQIRKKGRDDEGFEKGIRRQRRGGGRMKKALDL